MQQISRCCDVYSDAVIPMFSVIITNYNYGRFLRQCIDAVLSQDYQNFEIIVVDDSSTDDSRSVIESFGTLVKAVYKANGGVVSTCNSGFVEAHGQMIAFVDADDFLLPSALSVHARVLSLDNVVRSQGYLEIVDHDGTPTGCHYPKRRPEDKGILKNVLCFGPGGYFSTPTSGNAWSRGFLERVFPLRETRSVSCDSLLFDIAPLFGETITTDATVAAYRMHGSSMQDGKRTFSVENISKILEGYDFRATRLKEVAESLGYRVDPARWKSHNWRIATLRHIWSRELHTDASSGFIEHLRTACGCRKPSTTLIVLCAILAIRLGPLPVSRTIAGSMIKLYEM